MDHFARRLSDPASRAAPCALRRSAIGELVILELIWLKKGPVDAGPSLQVKTAARGAPAGVAMNLLDGKSFQGRGAVMKQINSGQPNLALERKPRLDRSAMPSIPNRERRSRKSGSTSGTVHERS